MYQSTHTRNKHPTRHYKATYFETHKGLIWFFATKADIIIALSPPVITMLHSFYFRNYKRKFDSTQTKL